MTYRRKSTCGDQKKPVANTGFTAVQSLLIEVKRANALSTQAVKNGREHADLTLSVMQQQQAQMMSLAQNAAGPAVNQMGSMMQSQMEAGQGNPLESMMPAQMGQEEPT